jgi:hypothetical protein
MEEGETNSDSFANKHSYSGLRREDRCQNKNIWNRTFGYTFSYLSARQMGVEPSGCNWLSQKPSGKDDHLSTLLPSDLRLDLGQTVLFRAIDQRKQTKRMRERKKCDFERDAAAATFSSSLSSFSLLNEKAINSRSILCTRKKRL